MLVFTLRNFFLFNFIYSVLNFNENYIRNFLIVSNKVFFFKKNIFLNFKKIIFYKLLKRRKILNLFFFYNFKIYLLNSKFFFNFNFFKFFKKKYIFFEKFFILKINFFLKNYIFEFIFDNYFFKILIFII